MNNIKIFLNTSSSVILSLFTFLFGTFDTSLKVLFLSIALDYITGVCKAIYNHKINSTIGLKGIIKKFGIIAIVSLSVIIGRLINEMETTRNLVIYFFVANEGISILENWGGMGLPLPKKIINVLEELKKKEEVSLQDKTQK